MSANGINYQFTTSGTNSGTQLFVDVNTVPGVGSGETTLIPDGGWSTYAEVSININQTATNGSPYFSTNGVTASNPNGYNSVFYKFAMHELLHAIGLANTNVASPPDIMNGVNSTNDTNNSLGDASQGAASLLTPCVISQVKAAITAIHKPAALAGAGGDPGGPPDLPAGSQGAGSGYLSGYSCINYSWDEWDDSTNTLTGYSDSVC